MPRKDDLVPFTSQVSTIFLGVELGQLVVTRQGPQFGRIGSDAQRYRTGQRSSDQSKFYEMPLPGECIWECGRVHRCYVRPIIPINACTPGLDLENYKRLPLWRCLRTSDNIYSADGAIVAEADDTMRPMNKMAPVGPPVGEPPSGSNVISNSWLGCTGSTAEAGRRTGCPAATPPNERGRF